MGDKEYYVGFNLCPTSVGWAVTDENYELLRSKGKDMWGVRLFEEANTAEDRRKFRNGRRKRQREKIRIRELKALFSEEIEKQDPGFFMRLEESMLWEEDRSEKNRQPFSLFFDHGYTDAEFYREYPTVFHLRMELSRSREPHDVRLVYLALLHMFRHRGHFLYSGLSAEEMERRKNFSVLWQDLCVLLEDYTIHLNRDREIKGLEERFCQPESSRRKYLEKIAKYLGIAKEEKKEYEVLKLLCGCSIHPGVIFEQDFLETSFSFRDTDVEEKIPEISGAIGNQGNAILEICKELYGSILLSQTLKGHHFLCEAKVASYEKHRMDLRKLKQVVKACGQTAYDEMFRVMKDGLPNYSAYIGSVNSVDEKCRRNDSNGKMRQESKSREQFYKYVTKIISTRKQEKEVQEILEEMKKETFLPKLNVIENGVIPNQIYREEMRTILENASEYLPFLKETDQEGRTVSERILRLFEFHIPFYIGPLGERYAGEKGYHVWVKRQEKGKICPWNLEEKIDVEETAEQYVRRTIRKCRYLPSENVLPENSMIYQKYLVLNELNGISVKGKKLPVPLKKALYKSLFLSGDSVRRTQVENFLICHQIIREEERSSVRGIEAQVKASLSTVGRFRRIFGDAVFKPENMEMIEKIVFWMTVFGEDKNFSGKLIREKYGDAGNGKLSGEQIEQILGFHIRGWGILSSGFLIWKGTEKSERIPRGILTALWETQDTLAELLSPRYSYLESMEQAVAGIEKPLKEWCPDDMEEMHFHPSDRRMIWQMIQILNEITELKKQAPSKIFLQIAKPEKRQSRKKESRKSRLLALYQKSGQKQWITEIEKRKETEFRMQRLYLYYLQQGRCMYTGEPIELSALRDFSRYKIVPVYPGNLIKDEHLENNLVLVKKEAVEGKSLSYPLPEKIRRNQNDFWNLLYARNFLTEEKFKRLVRSRAISDEEKAEWVGERFLETGRVAGCIVQMLQRALPETGISVIRGGFLNDFRRSYHLPKVRCINDLYTAEDAYLCVVLGNEYITGIRDTIKAADRMKSNIALIKRVLKRTTPLVTKRCFLGKGGIYNKDTVWNAKIVKEDSYLPQKMMDPRVADVTKYGGRTSINNMCYTLVEYQTGDKIIRSIEAIPLYLGAEHLTEEKITEYLLPKIKKEHRKKEVIRFRVCLKVIKYRALLKINGYYYYLGGKTGQRLSLDNAVQWKVDEKHKRYINRLERAVESDFFGAKRKNGEMVLTGEKNIELYQYILERIKGSIYKKRINFVGGFLEEKAEEFEKMELSEQCRLLIEIITGFQSGARKLDLHRIGGSPNSGVMFLNKKISECSEALLVCQSVAGVFSKEINLLKI